MNSTTNEQHLKIEQAEKIIKELRHPSFSITKQDDDLVTTITLTKDISTEFKEFFMPFLLRADNLYYRLRQRLCKLAEVAGRVYVDIYRDVILFNDLLGERMVYQAALS